MKKDPLVYLKHILDAISRIEEYGTGLKQTDFMKTYLVQDGVIRQLLVIGEATKKISEEITERFPKIPWKDMAGMRDKLVHDYLGVDLDAVCDTIKKDIPILKENLQNLVKNEEKT
jgi:uncharacterized protein with HEPN domain